MPRVLKLRKCRHSPAGLAGHHHINGVHPNAHDADDRLARFCIGQAEDAKGLKTGGIAEKQKEKPQLPMGETSG